MILLAYLPRRIGRSGSIGSEGRQALAAFTFVFRGADKLAAAGIDLAPLWPIGRKDAS